MSTLYRKYRPQNFTELVGQNHIKVTLEQEIKTGRIAHAYLFCGPRAVGKTTLARVLAKAINCEKRKETEAEPCNDCLSCREITEARALDIIEIDAASNTGVDNVRDNIIANARTTPSRAKYKVFIIDEVHMLSASAFNALLKIIEEPPTFMIFILCTTEAHKIPLTIISRCQRFDFKRIGVNEVVKKLSYIVQAEKIKVGKDILEAVARHADGHMRDAESLLGQIMAIASPALLPSSGRGESGRVSEKEITRAEADLVIPRSDLNEVINLLGLVVKKDAAGAIRLINQLVDDGVDFKIFVKDTIEILRKIMLIKINPALTDKLTLEMGEAIELKINQLARDLNIELVLKIIDRFIKVSGELKTDFIEQLSLEIAIVEICSLPAARNPLSSKTASSVNSPKIAYKTKESPALANESAPNINITSEQIMEKWNEVLAKVKQYNHSLSFILRVCQPRDFKGNQLCLAFKYKFHRDRVNEITIKNLVEKVLNQVYGTTISITAMVDENLEVAANKLVSDEPLVKTEPASASKKKEQSDMIDNLLKTFGGKIVN